MPTCECDHCCVTCGACACDGGCKNPEACEQSLREARKAHAEICVRFGASLPAWYPADILN